MKSISKFIAALQRPKSIVSIGDGAKLTVKEDIPGRPSHFAIYGRQKLPPRRASAHEKLVSARSPSPHPLSPRAGKARQDDLRRT